MQNGEIAKSTVKQAFHLKLFTALQAIIAAYCISQCQLRDIRTVHCSQAVCYTATQWDRTLRYLEVFNHGRYSTNAHMH